MHLCGVGHVDSGVLPEHCSLRLVQGQGFPSVSLSLADCLLSIQFDLSISWLINGLFAAATFLISFGVLIGKTTPTQLVYMAMLEMPLYSINNYIVIFLYHAVDMGGSMTIHMFGAYYGLAASFFLCSKTSRGCPDKNSCYNSDILAMVCTSAVFYSKHRYHVTNMIYSPCTDWDRLFVELSHLFTCTSSVFLNSPLDWSLFFLQSTGRECLSLSLSLSHFSCPFLADFDILTLNSSFNAAGAGSYSFLIAIHSLFF